MDSKFRIAVISHSLVHPRQQIFFKDLTNKFDVQILALGPRWWNNQTMNDLTEGNYQQFGFPCSNRGFMNLYFLLQTEDRLKEFKPHIIYCQAELWTKQAERAMFMSQSLKAKLVYFVWENVRPYTEKEAHLASYASMIICGNKDAEALLKKAKYERTIILPQVGISETLFKSTPEVKKEWDVLYTGRPALEKGIDMITKACQQLGLSFEIVTGKTYFELPEIYNKARIFCSFPIDTPLWKEQSGSYTNIEAQACKIPVVTSDAGAIPEYLKDTAIICKQGDIEDLKKGLLDARDKQDLITENIEAGYRNFTENYSNSAVAKKLYDNLKQIMSVKDFF